MTRSPEELWELVVGTGSYEHLNAGTFELCRERFLDGAREHGDDWLSWPDMLFEAEIDAEIADSINYGAMRIVARTHREGGVTDDSTGGNWDGDEAT